VGKRGQWLDHWWPDCGAKRQPYSVYDYSGSVASLYYGTTNYIGNPIVPLLPGITAKQASHPGAIVREFRQNFVSSIPLISDPSSWLRGPTEFLLATLPGAITMSPCMELPAATPFRGPFQVRFDTSLAKQFLIKERYQLRFEADAFNISTIPISTRQTTT